MNFDTPMFLYDQNNNILFVFTLQMLLLQMKNKHICLHCQYFKQTKDWRESLEGVYFPLGTCGKCPPWHKNHEEHHAGVSCRLFERKSPDL